MLFRLFLLFTILPVVELYLLFQLGRATTIETVVILVVLTGAAGATLARSQGLGVLRRIQFEMSEGRLPAGGLLDGLLILIGGAFLLTPGILTDLVGFFMLIPVTRDLFKFSVRNWLRRKIERGQVQMYYSERQRYDIDMDDRDSPRQ